MPGVGRTHGSPATKNAGGYHRYAETIRHSLRNGIRLMARSPRVPGLLAPVPPGSRRVDRKTDIAMTRELTSASGGQDHALLLDHPRLTRPVKPKCPSHPAANTRDDREAPLFVSAGRAKTNQ